MATTTASAVRAEVAALISALTPTTHAGDRFIQHREVTEFREWAGGNAGSCFRRFSIRNLGRFTAAPVTNLSAEMTTDVFELQVAYPTSGRQGPALTDLDDIVASDQLQIYAAVGPPGYASLTAPATVILEDDWSREVGPAVTFAVIRFRVWFYRDTGLTQPLAPVTVYGTGGTLLSAGDVVTGSAVKDVVIANGLVRVTYGTRTPDVQRGSHMLEVLVDGAWVESMEADYGDRAYFVVSIVDFYDRCTVIEASSEAVEVEFQRDVHDFSATPIVYLDRDGNLTYAQGGVNPNWKTLTTTKLVKVIRVQRGEPGYYTGWKSNPRIGPIVAGTFQSNTAWGEREIGSGGGAAVAWSSAGRTARWPAWADDVDGRWTAQGLQAVANKIWWSGIGTYPSYAPYTGADWIAVQGTGFPGTSTAGPWYVGEIHYDTAGKPIAKIFAFHEEYEVGGFLIGTRGGTILHFANETYRHQMFIGGVPYRADSSSAFANEPSPFIRSELANLAAGLNWPAH